MVYRFLILSDEADDFKREIKIDSEATFLDLYNIIMDSVGYSKDHWSKTTEITLVEMDTSSDTDSYTMADTHLDELLEDEHQKLLFVFDYMTDRALFMELREIITGQDLKEAICTKSTGNPPAQTMSFEELESKTSNLDLDEDFYGDSDYNIDELDRDGYEGFGDSVIDNPYDDDRY